MMNSPLKRSKSAVSLSSRYSTTRCDRTHVLCVLLPAAESFRYKADINTLNQLLDSNEEAKLEEVKKLVQEIQELRRKSPEVSCRLLKKVQL